MRESQNSQIQSFKGCQALGFPVCRFPTFKVPSTKVPDLQTSRVPGFPTGFQSSKVQSFRITGFHSGSTVVPQGVPHGVPQRVPQGVPQGVPGLHCKVSRPEGVRVLKESSQVPSKVPAGFQASVPGFRGVLPTPLPAPEIETLQNCCWELGLVEKLSFRSKRQQWFRSRSTGSTLTIVFGCL